MRNWPYAYAIGKANKKAPKFAVAPFPDFQGGGKAGILGGHNIVISAFSKNPGGALALTDYLTSEEAIKRDATDYSLAPVLQATYDDPDVQKALPFAAQLKQAIAQAKSRPVSPVYTQISQAIYKNVNSALSGQTSPEDALKTGQSEMEKALATF
jgi:multiple sugar transport system substrate-binding protein